MPFGWCKGLKAEALFEADDSVLNFEGIQTQFEDGDPDGDRKDDEPSGEETEVFECVESDDEEVDSQDSCKNHVERRINAAMVFEVLLRGLAHDNFSIFFGLRICPERLRVRSSDASCDGGLIVRAGKILREPAGGCQCRIAQC